MIISLMPSCVIRLNLRHSMYKGLDIAEHQQSPTVLNSKTAFLVKMNVVPRQLLRRASAIKSRLHSRADIPPQLAPLRRQLHAATSTSFFATPSERPTSQRTSRRVVQPSLPSRRTLFIQTEPTPNQDVRHAQYTLFPYNATDFSFQALKFKPNHRVLPEDFTSPYLEYMSPRSTLAPPHPSPLAAQLFNVDGVTSVFYGTDYITVTKDTSANWGHVKPEVFSLITEAVTGGKPFVNTVEGGAGADGAEEQSGSAEVDTLKYDANDSEVVSMIKELLETRIRPAIQEDGGDIDFRGFKDGWVMLKLRGACRTCDSSTVTLRNGIESMLMH